MSISVLLSTTRLCIYVWKLTHKYNKLDMLMKIEKLEYFYQNILAHPSEL